LSGSLPIDKLILISLQTWIDSRSLKQISTLNNEETLCWKVCNIFGVWIISLKAQDNYRRGQICTIYSFRFQQVPSNQRNRSLFPKSNGGRSLGMRFDGDGYQIPYKMSESRNRRSIKQMKLLILILHSKFPTTVWSYNQTVLRKRKHYFSDFSSYSEFLIRQSKLSKDRRPLSCGHGQQTTRFHWCWINQSQH
jgi:hypothetical protein